MQTRNPGRLDAAGGPRLHSSPAAHMPGEDKKKDGFLGALTPPGVTRLPLECNYFPVGSPPTGLSPTFYRGEFRARRAENGMAKASSCAYTFRTNEGLASA